MPERTVTFVEGPLDGATQQLPATKATHTTWEDDQRFTYCIADGPQGAHAHPAGECHDYPEHHEWSP